MDSLVESIVRGTGDEVDGTYREQFSSKIKVLAKIEVLFQELCGKCSRIRFCELFILK